MPPTMVLTSQNTEIGFPPASAAVQANAFPEVTVRLGVVVEPEQSMALMAVAALIVILAAVVVRVVCAWAIAVMVTILRLLAGTVAGAVYRPFVLMVPKVELPPATPPASQVTRVLLRFVMVAVHCVCPFTVSEEAAQEADIAGVAGGVVELPLPQEFKAKSAGRSAKSKNRRCHRASWRHTEPLS